MAEPKGLRFCLSWILWGRKLHGSSATPAFQVWNARRLTVQRNSACETIRWVVDAQCSPLVPSRRSWGWVLSAAATHTHTSRAPPIKTPTLEGAAHAHRNPGSNMGQPPLGLCPAVPIFRPSTLAHGLTHEQQRDQRWDDVGRGVRGCPLGGVSFWRDLSLPIGWVPFGGHALGDVTKASPHRPAPPPVAQLCLMLIRADQFGELFSLQS